jgi:deoxyribonuclease IV
MHELLFGPGGVPRRTPEPKTSEAGIRVVASLGLGCMEMEFVHGVKMGEPKAAEVADAAGANHIMLSAHGPYYINLNTREPEKLAASRERILQTARAIHRLGGRSAVFHAAFRLGDPPGRLYETVRKELEGIVRQLEAEGNPVLLRPETTGKPTQFGSLDEIIRLSRELKQVAPCIDFAHLHALDGKSNTYREFCAILDKLGKELGQDALSEMHIHVSGIQYGTRGEKEHGDFADADFNYREFVKALRDCDAHGLVICESEHMEDDALKLQAAYRALD